jgi:hypothetical protein
MEQYNETYLKDYFKSHAILGHVTLNLKYRFNP